MLYVFSGADQLSADFLSTCTCFLPKWRLDQMRSFRFPADQKLCAIAYLLLIHALKKECIFNALPEFGYHADGKPFLTNYPGIYFNLSHCGNVAVCLLSDAEVGVDVEKVGEYDDELALVICNEKEYRWISGFIDPHLKAKKFTEIWTRKESLVKWRGTGLNCDPREILPAAYPEIPEESFHVSSIYDEAGDFYISVCSINKQE